MTRRMIWMGLLAVALVLSSGCSSLASMMSGDPGVTDREVRKIKPHPARDVTIVKTLDKYGYGDDARHETRYWYCKQEETQLQCRRACGAETKCPEGGSSIRASLAPRASLLEDQPSRAASKPSSDTSGDQKAEGPADAADEMTDSDDDAAESDDEQTDESTDKQKGGDQ